MVGLAAEDEWLAAARLGWLPVEAAATALGMATRAASGDAGQGESGLAGSGLQGVRMGMSFRVLGVACHRPWLASQDRV